MKIISYFCGILVTVSFFGCTKTGAAGPAGANGANGQSIVALVDSFTVSTGSWINNGGNQWMYTYFNSNITQQIVNAGTIEVFSKATPTGNWYAWPDVVAGGSGYRYSYTEGSITLYGDNFSSAPSSAPYIKAVILN